MSIHQPEADDWEHDNVITCYAPSHIVQCHTCGDAIPAGVMFHVTAGRPAHTRCPTNRSHLRLVP